MPLQFEVPHVEHQWADSRETHIAVATAIHAISLPGRSAEAIWEEPSVAEWGQVHIAVENYIDSGVFSAQDNGRYPWGEECVIIEVQVED